MPVCWFASALLNLDGILDSPWICVNISFHFMNPNNNHVTTTQKMEKKISSSAKQGVIQLVSFLPCQVEPIRGIYSLQATHEPCTTPRWSPFHEAWWTMVIGSPNKRWRETIDIVNHCMHRTVYRNMVNISSKILLISTSCHFPDAGLHTHNSTEEQIWLRDWAPARSGRSFLGPKKNSPCLNFNGQESKPTDSPLSIGR